MATQPDFELQGNAVIDESQFQDQAEGLQFEMQGDSEAIEQAQDMNEERNDKLGIMSRGILQVASKFKTLLVIIGVVAGILASLAAIFDWDFQDIRNGIVNAITGIIDTIGQTLESIGNGISNSIGNLIDSIKELFNVEEGGGPPTASTVGEMSTNGPTESTTGTPGFLTENGEVVGGTPQTAPQINVNIPRDSFQGDSTQKDIVTDDQNNAIFDWGT